MPDVGHEIGIKLDAAGLPPTAVCLHCTACDIGIPDMLDAC